MALNVQGQQPRQERARFVISGIAHHVIQRGHNRQVAFATDEDFQYYLGNPIKLKKDFGVKLYVYCLMTNHVHLLLLPPAANSLALLLKHVARRQSPVETAIYVLACSRYIELIQYGPGS